MMDALKLKDGQMYRWHWADTARHADSGPYRSYHCKSQIAVVKDGMLIDTFWSDMSSERAVDPDLVELSFLCETSWPTISMWKLPYYDPADIADTRHSNNSRAPIYLRPGATYSASRLLEEVAYREENARSDIASAERLLERLSRTRLLIETGKLDEVAL